MSPSKGQGRRQAATGEEVIAEFTGGADIGDGGGGEQGSDAQMNGTFITVDGSEIEGRYNVGIRNRGAGTAGRPPGPGRLGSQRMFSA